MRKYLPAIFISLFVLLALSGAVWFGIRSTRQPQPATLTQASTETSTDSGAPLVPESDTQPQTGQSLGVSSGGDIGSALQSNLGQSSGGNSSNSGGSSSNKSGAATVLDPTTFAQYDKYKDPKYTSGLMADIVEGTGAEATLNSKVTVTYKGWLTDGELFDQSKTDDQGVLQAFQFVIGEHKVIPGWEQDVIGMKVGGRRLFIIPPSVGYGATGQGQIPGNSVLVFDVSLLASE